MTNTPLYIREVRPNDVAAVKTLFVQLGYEVPESDLITRITRTSERRLVLVAAGNDRVVGLISVALDEPFVEGWGGHIEGLIVEEATRCQGIGELLIDAAEAWVLRHGCNTICVHSNVLRNRAHTFYERHGYAKVKAQYLLRKPL